MTSNILFFTTIADVPKKNPLYTQRKQQYEKALTKVFSYCTQVHGVISETNSDTQDLLSASEYPFASLHIIPSTSKYNCINKSMKEYTSIQLAIQNLPNTTISDTAWIIKLSGRYLIIDDSFFTTVKNAPDSCNFIGKHCDNNSQIFTFYYAMRYKYFKQFLQKHNTILWSKNVELYILEFLKEKQIYDSSIFVTNLGIYANICDSVNYITV
jgi:hypothetical protein